MLEKFPLSKIADFLVFAEKQELYDLWKVAYPLMLTNQIDYISLEDYQNRVLAQKNCTQNNLTEEEIDAELLPILDKYEKSIKTKKVGSVDGNI